VVITGLTKLKLGDVFQGLPNITLATSNGLVHSWGANLQPRQHCKRMQLQTLAAAAAAVVAGGGSTVSGTPSRSRAGTGAPLPMFLMSAGGADAGSSDAFDAATPGSSVKNGAVTFLTRERLRSNSGNMPQMLSPGFDLQQEMQCNFKLSCVQFMFYCNALYSLSVSSLLVF
jgi:hypothetical protein